MDSQPPRVEQLRLLGVSDDGSRILLEGPDGAPYALALDERVHAALRGDRARLGQLQIELENQLTPREIQARIRAGQTAEEIALSAQVPVDRVRRFEGPVLQERWHVAEMAQSTNVRRVTDSSAHPLSELVLERLAASGVEPEDMSWDARRREDGRWAVRLDYLHGGRERSATWLFDHQRRTLEPHDQEAGWLTADERAVPEPTRSQRGRTRPAVPAPAPEPEPEPEVVPGPPRLSAVPDVDEVPDVADEALDTFEDADVDVDVPDDAPEIDLVDEPTAEPDGPLRPTTGARPARSSKRASVPSWDEILFGGPTPPED
jgi:Protein of unknown function (DUF3071)